MKKRIAALLIVGMIFMSATMAEASVIPAPQLSFSGTTANCIGQVAAPACYVTATLSLWQGNTELISWSQSGYHSIYIQESCDVAYGITYTLKLNGTINGVAFPEASVRRTNYEPNK
nr:hypothetical protein [Lachnospiraceae bacterium]